jgi:hypothetical protein
MTRDEKAQLYDDLVRDGDSVNRQISRIKTSINRTPEEEAELGKLNEKLQHLESRLHQLLSEG